jgi:hypothetical protein
LTSRYVIFAIYRDPVSVMLSYWRYMHHFQPDKNIGPRVDDPLTFAMSEPFGTMLRYQTQPCPTLLDRWATHVRSWHAAALGFPNIRLVRYEDLDLSFEETMKSFKPLLGREPIAIARPSRDRVVIPHGPDDPIKRGITPDIEALRRLCREQVGNTMALLGY